MIERILKMVVMVVIVAAMANPKVMQIVTVAIQQYTGIDISQYTSYLTSINLDDIKKQINDFINGTNSTGK